MIGGISMSYRDEFISKANNLLESGCSYELQQILYGNSE